MNFCLAGRRPIKRLITAKISFARQMKQSIGINNISPNALHVSNLNGGYEMRKIADSGLPWAFLGSSGKCVCAVLDASSCQEVFGNDLSTTEAMKAMTGKLSNLGVKLCIDVSHAQSIWAKAVTDIVLTRTNNTIYTVDYGAHSIFAKQNRGAFDMYCRKNSTNYLAFLQMFAQDHNLTVLPSLGQVTKALLADKLGVTEDQVYLAAVGNKSFCGTCDFILSTNALRKLCKLLPGGHGQMYNLCGGCSLQQAMPEDMASILLVAIKYAQSHTPLSIEDIIYHAGTKSTPASIGVASTTYPIMLNYVSAEHKIESLNKWIAGLKLDNAIHIILPTTFSGHTNFVPNNSTDICLRLAQLEHLCSTKEFNLAFSQLYGKYLMPLNITPNQPNVLPPNLRQLLHNLVCNIVCESGHNKALSQQALMMGDYTTSHALECIAQKQLSNASDCLLLLKADADLKKNLQDRVELQHQLVASTKAILNMATTMGQPKLASTISLVHEHTNNALNMLVGLSLSANSNGVGLPAQTMNIKNSRLFLNCN